MSDHALTAEVSRLAAEVEELQHILLCLCLQMQPADGTGQNMADQARIVQTQEREIAKLVKRLMGAAARASGPPPLIEVDAEDVTDLEE